MQIFNRKTTVSLATALGLVFGAAQAKAEEFVNILTGGTSGVYYPLGVAMEKIYSSIPDVRPSVQATKASIENINLINSGRGEVAFTLGDSLRDAYEGNEAAGFKKKLTNLSTLAAIYPNYVQIVASKESGIKTLADLKGKRLSVVHRNREPNSMRAPFWGLLDFPMMISARSNICPSRNPSS